MGLINWGRTRSPWIISFNTGGCDGCDIEVLAVLTPRFDVERFGIALRGSPRHADALVVTGLVTRRVKDRIVRIYEQMPEPKFVIAVGRVEAPRGELVHYVKANGTDKTERYKVRSPTLGNMPSLCKMLVGEQIADVPIVLVGIDPCFVCVDRMAFVDVNGENRWFWTDEELRSTR